MYILSPTASYEALLEHAAVVVDVVDDSSQEIIEWHPRSSKKAGIIAFVSRQQRESLLEISFGTATPYGRKVDNPHLYPRQRAKINISSMLWEYVKHLVFMLVEERSQGRQNFFLNSGQGGKRFWRIGRRIKVRVYRGQKQIGFRHPIRKGILIGISERDADILRLFFSEEMQSSFWRQKRLPWFVDTIVNKLMAEWKPKMKKVPRDFREFVSDPAHDCFFRREVLRVLLPKIGRPDLFLSALEECGRICFLEREELLHELRLRKKNAFRQTRENGVKLDFVFRGKRRNGSYRFEVFPEEGKM